VHQEVFSSYRLPSSQSQSELITPRQIQRLVIGGPQMMQGTDGQCRNKHVRKKIRNGSSNSCEGTGSYQHQAAMDGFSNAMARSPSLSSYRQTTYSNITENHHYINSVPVA
jgi:hypothetical protein